MSLFKSVVDAIVEKEDPEPMPHSATAVSVPRTAVSPDLDTTTLRMKVEGASNAGTAFANALQSLAEYIPDEGSRFKAARKMLANQGIDIDRVMSDVELALGRVETECQNFDAAKANKTSQEVDGPSARLKELDAQIAQLTQERGAVSGALVNTVAMIERREREFHQAADTLRGNYTGMLDKIKTYLRGK